jgi:hypothetical protein
MKMNWMDILKTQETISDMGFDFDLPEEESPEEDRNCCEEARQKFIDMFDDIHPTTKSNIKNWTCERLKSYLINFSSRKPRPLSEHLKTNSIEDRQRALDWINNQQKILDEWEECENE